MSWEMASLNNHQKMFWFFEFYRRLVDIDFELLELFRSWIYFRGTKIQMVMSSSIKKKMSIIK